MPGIQYINKSQVEKIIADALAVHVADYNAHMADLYQGFKVGAYMPPFPAMGDGDIALVADRLYLAPFYVNRAMTIDRLAIDVTTLAAGKIARLGIYEDSGDYETPGTLIIDAGTVSVAAGSGATVEATINQSLTKGLYWLAVVSDGTPTVVWWRPSVNPLGWRGNTFDEDNAWGGLYKDAVGAGALADPCVGSLSHYTNYIPAVIPRLKSLD